MKREVPTAERLLWIDMLRGICMIAILLFHTEVYYAGDAVIPYSFYVDNALTIFFFVSGYLFMQRDTEVSPKFVKHKARSVGRGLLLPYFLLSVVLSLPKSIVRNIALPQLMIQIVTGRAYWFVAALIVAETIFLLLLWISRGNGWKLFVLTVLSLGLLPVALQFDGGLPWHAENALLAMPFLFAGYMYRRHEEVCNRLCGWPAVLAASMAIVGMKAFDYIHSLPIVFAQ